MQTGNIVIHQHLMLMSYIYIKIYKNYSRLNTGDHKTLVILLISSGISFPLKEISLKFIYSNYLANDYIKEIFTINSRSKIFRNTILQISSGDYLKQLISMRFGFIFSRYSVLADMDVLLTCSMWIYHQRVRSCCFYSGG